MTQMYRWAYRVMLVGAVFVLVGLLLLWRQAYPSWVGAGSLGLGVLLAPGYFVLRGRLIHADTGRWSPPAVLQIGAAAAGLGMGLATLWLAAADLMSSEMATTRPSAGMIPLLGVLFAVLVVAAVLSDPD